MLRRVLGWATLVLLLSSSGVFAQEEVLTNRDVIEMTSKKVPEALIMRAIETKPCDFTFNKDDIIVLTEAGVSENVVTMMWDKVEKQKGDIDVKIQMLVNSLRSPDLAEYRRAVAGLRRIGVKAVGKLMGYLTSPDELVRGGVTEALGEIGDRRAVDPLFDLLDDEHPGVRAKAAKALAAMGGKEITKRLMEGLKKGLKYKDGPALALGYLKETEAVEPLVNLMQNELAADDDRASAAFALGLIGELKTLDPLIEELQVTRIARLRESAAVSISRIGPFFDKDAKVKSAKALVQAYDRYPQSRARLAEALGEFPLPQVIEILIEGLKDRNPEVQEACYRSLKNLTGETMDRDYEQWSSWFQLARVRFEMME